MNNNEQIYFRCLKCSSPNTYKEGVVGNKRNKYKCGDCGQIMYLDLKNKILILKGIEPQWVKF